MMIIMVVIKCPITMYVRTYGIKPIRTYHAAAIVTFLEGVGQLGQLANGMTITAFHTFPPMKSSNK